MPTGYTSLVVPRLRSVRPPLEGEILCGVEPDNIPEGWMIVHTRGSKKTGKKHTIAKTIGFDGRHLILLRSGAAKRCQLVYGITPKWVSQCTYAVYGEIIPE